MNIIVYLQFFKQRFEMVFDKSKRPRGVYNICQRSGVGLMGWVLGIETLKLHGTLSVYLWKFGNSNFCFKFRNHIKQIIIINFKI